MSIESVSHVAPVAPTPSGERILALDAVRGFAAFGILMVNVQTFGGPYPLFSGEPFQDALSQAIYALVDVVFVSKFYPLFSLLFGLGLSMQIRAVEASGASAPRFVVRRLAGLLLIGVVHVAFLSTIDILVQYAFLGLSLLFLRRVSNRTLLGMAAACLGVPLVFSAISAFSPLLHGIYGDVTATEMIAAYAHGSLREVWLMRAEEIRGYYVWVAVQAGWQMLAMILVGAYVERRGFVAELGERRDQLGRIARRAFAVAVPAAVLHAALWMTMRRGGHPPPAMQLGASIAGAFGEPTMAIGYASAIAWLALDPRWARCLAPLALVGRMALSSYVLQSLGMSMVFFSFGLGRYGEDPPVAWVAFVLAFFALEVLVARVHARRFRHGPMEMVWRKLTYGRRFVPIAPSEGRY